jgi:hypothetical protein
MSGDKEEGGEKHPPHEKIERREDSRHRDNSRPSKEIANDQKIWEATDWDKPPPPPPRKK